MYKLSRVPMYISRVPMYIRWWKICTLGNKNQHTPQCMYCHPVYKGGRQKCCSMHIPNVSYIDVHVHWVLYIGLLHQYTLGTYISMHEYALGNIFWIYIGYIHWSVFIYIGVFFLLWGFIDGGSQSITSLTYVEDRRKPSAERTKYTLTFSSMDPVEYFSFGGVMWKREIGVCSDFDDNFPVTAVVWLITGRVGIDESHSSGVLFWFPPPP